MLLENEGEILSMTVMETYSGQSPIVIDNDDKVISLDISALSAQLSGFNTFSGVITDTTLTGDGYNTPLGVNDIQSLSSDESISITVTGNNVMLGVASGWFNGAVNSAYSGMTAYVPYSATNLAIGYSNDAYQNSFSQGNSNEARQNSFAQGDDNISQWESLTQGTSNITYYRSFAQGFCNSAGGTSLAQGNWNSAYGNSFAQGNWNVAERISFAQGDSNSAYNVSQAFGAGNIITDTGMVIGTFNKTSSDASFVIGNGSSVYDEDLQVDIITRSDSFIIYHDGSVSAMGKISANGVELGGGYIPTYHGIEI